MNYSLLEETETKRLLNDFFKTHLEESTIDDTAELFANESFYNLLLDEHISSEKNARIEIEYELIRQILLLGNEDNQYKMIVSLIDNNRIDDIITYLNTNERFKQNILKAYLEGCIDKNNKELFDENNRMEETLLLLFKLMRWKKEKMSGENKKDPKK